MLPDKIFLPIDRCITRFMNWVFRTPVHQPTDADVALTRVLGRIDQIDQGQSITQFLDDFAVEVFYEEIDLYRKERQ